ncbi:PQ-loop domain-containing transporter [Fangia hongkongensis]|nr:hypothetical protein [Fangia hongkongensis]
MYEYAVRTAFSLALFLNGILFVPQVLRICKERSSSSVSLITFFGFIVIQFTSVLYGILIDDWILILGYSFSMITCGLVIISLVKYHDKSSL